MLSIMNWFAGWFGYQWVKDTRPFEREEDDPMYTPISDEGWDDIHQFSPRYILKKK